MIKAVLFDFGGVLSTAGTKGSVERTIADYFGIDSSEVKLDPIRDRLRRGQITTEKFFEELAKRHSSQTPMTGAMFLNNYVSFLKPSRSVYVLASKLRKNGMKTGILSNIFEMSAKVLRTNGLYRDFNPVILSCEVNMAKPDLEIYRLAVKKTGVKPEETIFVDDQEKCWPPALELGMKVVEAVSPEQIVRDVKKIILQENGILL